jgi:hypothetical protein
MKDQLTPINGVSFFFRLADFDQKSDQKVTKYIGLGQTIG